MSVEEVQRQFGLTDLVKLASNENPLGPSPKAVEAVQRAAAKLNTYPDMTGRSLRAKIAAKFGVESDSVILGNGSDELIHLIGLLFLDGPGDQAIVCEPSFSRYDAVTELQDSALVRVPLRPDMSFDLDNVAGAVTPHTKLIFLANPNNPTGTIIPKDQLASFLSRLPNQVVTVLDEAYYEFADGDPEYPNSVDLIKQGHQVIGLRTFSKAYGLAGIRIGYGFASMALSDAFNRARSPFNCNALALAAAEAALDDDAFIQRTLEINRRGIERLRVLCSELGYRTYTSHANFLLVDVGRPADECCTELLHKGIIVRTGSIFGLETCLRISIGTEEEMDRLETALRDLAKVLA